MLHSLPSLIYFVEDNKDDRRLLQIAFAKHNPLHTLCFFTDGVDLLTHLTHQLDGRLPNVICLDLRTPLLNGFDTLHLLKQTPAYQKIPVIIRSGYDSLENINRCYALGCHAFLAKGQSMKTLLQLINELNQ